MATGDEGRKPKPFLLLFGATLLLVAAASCYMVVWNICLHETDGHFTYALDDPYIHLAIARNFTFHHIWGVTPFSNSAASSSPLWVFLLCALFAIGGEWLYWPLVLGILFSIGATLFLYCRFVRAGLAIPWAAAAAAAVFAAGPFHVLPFAGMEHSLQVLLDLVFLFWLLEKLDRTTERKDLWIGFSISFLICLCRYESVFLLVVPFFACLVRKDWRLATALAVGPACAIGGFGLFAHALGMPYLPNSIVLKGTVPNTFSIPWFQAMYLHLRGRSLALSDLFMLCILAGLAMRLRGLRETSGALQTLVWTMVAACLLHAGLAAIGFFYRYEAYLVVLTATVVVLSLHKLLAHSGPSDSRPITTVQWVLAVAAVVGAQFVLARMLWFYQLHFNLIEAVYGTALLSIGALATGPPTLGRLTRSLLAPLGVLAIYFVVFDRATQAYSDVRGGVSDVYRQQYQMSRFVARYYPRGRLAANDIGALSYFTHVHLLDLWGLASDNVRKFKVDKNWNSKTIQEAMDGFRPDIVIVYPQWFVGDRALPSWLIPVGSWTTPKVTSAARSVVMFYAPSQPAAAILRSQMVEFQSSLPTKVTVRYGEDAISHVPRL